nr:hypothetical protein [Tanacetum cinerariifolium]
RCCLYRALGRLGHDWHLEPGLWLPQDVGSLGVSDFLRSVRMPMVQLLANHDQRSHAAWQGVPVLQLVFNCWKDECIHWPPSQQCHY